MKKIITLLLFALAFMSTKAQITKGIWLVGGSASFSFDKKNLEDYSAISFQIHPITGIFLLDKFATGIKPGYEYSKYTIGSSTAKYTNFYIGPFIRYYFLKTKSEVNIVAEGNYGWIIGGSGTKIHNYSFLGGPVIFFNSNVGLEFTVGYSNSKVKSDQYGPIKKFFGAIGFQIHLGKQKKK